MELTDQHGEWPIGTVKIEWELSDFNGDFNSGLTYIVSSAVSEDKRTLIIKTHDKETPEKIAKFNISTNIINENGSEAVGVSSRTITVLNETIIMTKETNPVVLEICKTAGWADDAEYMSKENASVVESLGTHFANVKSAFTFNEIEFFTKLTGLADGAFANSNLTEIKICENIRTIGPSAFKNCEELVNVQFIGENINTINAETFLGCKSLKNIVLPKSVQYIENNAFGGVGIKNILFDDNSGKQLLDKTLYIPLDSELSKIKNNAFEDTYFANNGNITSTNLLEEISLPSSFNLYDISDYNFVLSKHLRKINVHNDNKNIIIKDNAVLVVGNNETRLVRMIPSNDMIETLDLSDVTEIFPYAFYSCSSIKEVKFGKLLKPHGLQEGAFYESNIEKVDLGETGVEQLYKYTFNNMPLLNEVILPKTLTTLGHHLFVNCQMLTSIDLPDSIVTLEAQSNHAYTFDNCGFIELKLPEKMGSNVAVRSILCNCQNLVSVILPAYLKNHSQGNVIVNCPLLEEVTLPIFTYTYNNENVVVNNSITMGEYKYISNCGNLKKYKLNPNDNRLYYIDTENDEKTNGAVYYNDLEGLKIIAVPYSATDYKDYIIDNVKYIGVGAFANTNIDSFISNDNLISIEPHAFRECNNLKTVVLSKNINTINENTFFRCYNLENVTILGDIKSIKSFAFCDCHKLSKFVLLSSIVPEITNNDIVEIVYNGIRSYSYNYHPFGYRADNLVGISSNFENVCYLPYNYENNLDGYNTTPQWVTPLFNENLCNFKKKVLTLNNETNSEYVTLNVYKEGQIYTDTIYLKSDAGKLIFSENGSTYSSTYSLNAPEGYKIRFNNNVYHNEPIYVYSDSECTDMIGEFMAKYGVNEYVIGEPIMGNTRNTAMFATTLFGMPEEKEEVVEMANITKKEYEALLSRVNQMAELLNKLK